MHQVAKIAVAVITPIPITTIKMTVGVNLFIITLTGVVTKPRYIVILIGGMLELSK